jgi:hypothetical protein
MRRYHQLLSESLKALSDLNEIYSRAEAPQIHHKVSLPKFGPDVNYLSRGVVNPEGIEFIFF